MSISWPATVPLQFALDTASYTAPDGEIVETEMQEGPARRRKATLENWTITPVRLSLTATQLEAFWTFYTTTTNHGQSSFSAEVHRSYGCEAKTCRFKGPRPSQIFQGSRTQVFFTLAIRDYYD